MLDMRHDHFEITKNATPKSKRKPFLQFLVLRDEYLYGCKFTVINNHQLLKSVFSKSILTCPPGIQKFFLSLQKYEFDLKYSPGKTMLVSHALSQAYLKPEFDENSLIHHMHFVISNLPISNKSLEHFKEETRKDPILQTLIKYTIEGWPENTLFSHELYSYFTHGSDISYYQGLLLKDH